MKISKIDVLGDTGRLITEFEWDEPEAYVELAKIQRENLLVFVRGDNVNRFNLLAKNISKLVHRRALPFVLKYDTTDYAHLLSDLEKESNRRFMNTGLGPEFRGWHRVTGKVNEKNQPMGIFGDTELLWHSNSFREYDFPPLVALYGHENMSQSATSFVDTCGWYDKQTESFKSELDDITSICYQDARTFVPNGRPADILMVEGYINHNNIEDTSGTIDGNERAFKMPLVVEAVNGRKGLHFSYFVTGFENMTKKESDSLLKKIKDEILADNVQYDFWWNDTGDLILFDNAVCMHMRKMSDAVDMTARLHERVGHRISGDYVGYEHYNPFFQDPYRSYRQKTLDKICGKWKI